MALASCATAQPPLTTRVFNSPLPSLAPTPAPTPAIVRIPYRVDVRAPGGEDFAPTLEATMADARGWRRAGFVVVPEPEAKYVVVLADGPEVDALCRPYDTFTKYSCQNGPVVAINADRWRTAVPHWPRGDLAGYRAMLLNHEMGHLLGQHHVGCTPARQAPVMYQQGGGLGGCLPNPWPLAGEIARAARHDLKIAPAYGE